MIISLPAVETTSHFQMNQIVLKLENKERLRKPLRLKYTLTSYYE